jgi:hypothetical protein
MQHHILKFSNKFPCRTMLWSLGGYGIGAFVISIEWTVFVITHSWSHASWKSRLAEPHTTPSWVAVVMRDNFKTPLGAFTMTGIFGLPMWLLMTPYVSPSCWFHFQQQVQSQYIERAQALRYVSQELSLLITLALVTGRSVMMNDHF